MRPVNSEVIWTRRYRPRCRWWPRYEYSGCHQIPSESGPGDAARAAVASALVVGSADADTHAGAAAAALAAAVGATGSHDARCGMGAALGFHDAGRPGQVLHYAADGARRLEQRLSVT